MRISRRLGLYATKKPKYTWAVYEAKHGAGPGGAEVYGSFMTNNTASRRYAATSYSATSSGFTLVNPQLVSYTQLSVGMYVVTTSPSGSSETTGYNIFQITDIANGVSSGMVFSYRRYVPELCLKGDIELNRVSSDTLDYPVDGVQGSYYYVLVAGNEDNSLVYRWERYSASMAATQTDSSYTDGGPFTTMTRTTRVGGANVSVMNMGSSILHTIGGSQTDYLALLNDYNPLMLINPLVDSSADTSTTGPSSYQVVLKDVSSSLATVEVTPIGTAITKGSYHSTVTSSSVNAYPKNGVNFDDGYWYVRTT